MIQENKSKYRGKNGLFVTTLTFMFIKLFSMNYSSLFLLIQ